MSFLNLSASPKRAGNQLRGEVEMFSLSEGSGPNYRVKLGDLFMPPQLEVPDETLAGLLFIIQENDIPFS